MSVKNNRLWRMRIWLSLPQKIVAAEPPEETGSALQKIKMIDIYPEISCLRSSRLTVMLKRNDSTKEKEANYLLECYVKGKDPKITWDSISGTIELILDKIAFAFQITIEKVHFDALDLTPPIYVQSEREGLVGNELPSIQKDAKLQMLEEWGNKISPKLLTSQTDEIVEASLRWYSKGLTADSIVEKFAFYWISLEILSSPVAPKQRIFFKCQKCNHEIQECPVCHTSSQHFPDTKERLKLLVTSKLGQPLDVFEKLWIARMMFHGRNKLTEEEVKELLNNTIELKQITLKALKLRLGLTEYDSPVLIRSGVAIAGDPFLTVRRRITKEDINSFQKAKPLLKATLYKNKRTLG